MQNTGSPIVFVFIVILALIGVIIWGIRELVVRVKLGRSGVKVDGYITDSRQESAGRGGKSYYLTYSYDYGDSAYSREERVSSDLYYKLTNGVQSDLYYQLTKGGKVSVICLPGDPKTARLGYKIANPLASAPE